MKPSQNAFTLIEVLILLSKYGFREEDEDQL
jgi:hypothetical protein